MTESLPFGKMNIVFVASECTPWSKTGGLGDVVRDLPIELAKRGHRVMSIQPRYDQYRDGWDTSVVINVPIGPKGNTTEVRFFHTWAKGVDRVFVDHPVFLEKVKGKTGNKLYGPKSGVDYTDGPLRFAILAQAALEAPLKVALGGFPYGEDVVFVCNDWHTSLVPVYLKAHYKSKGIYANAPVAFILHNIIYQGRFPYKFFDFLHIPKEFEADVVFPTCFSPPPLDGISDEPIVSTKPVKLLNFLQAAFIHSDKLFTVSPTFAEEICSGEDKGVELSNLLKDKGIQGILNGMEVTKWNPKKDPFLPCTYGADTLEKKMIIKTMFQAEAGLDADTEVPLIGFVGRLDDQKGVDVLLEVVPYIVNELKAQVVLLGTGKATTEEKLKKLETLFPGKAAGITTYSEQIEHLLTAGCDYMCLPSRFEPCGLVQLNSMRMGTVPIVTLTGGLRDSVGPDCGYQMDSVPSPPFPGMKITKELLSRGVEVLKEGLKVALADFGTPAFAKKQKACLKYDPSWEKKTVLYEQAFYKMVGKPVGDIPQLPGVSAPFDEAEVIEVPSSKKPVQPTPPPAVTVPATIRTQVPGPVGAPKTTTIKAVTVA
eukprot:CAMPEP_0196654134 /NCGR_PEP_ID=MMETSP1086-20130531/3812_1 /TAXON_ID=77921 /ORGANISM="Cyanoptyche  gloeocystis , Strain SAG4.97" /LENGTH=596 /DNA_ID=CAMNT_0041985713 /DNA_START=189 /DNA_END=1979 /DNA_ORIENTATION=+